MSAIREALLKLRRVEKLTDASKKRALLVVLADGIRALNDDIVASGNSKDATDDVISSLVRFYDELSSDLSTICTRRTHTLVCADIARQKWEHTQPYMKDSKLSPGVVALHVTLQSLLWELLQVIKDPHLHSFMHLASHMIAAVYIRVLSDIVAQVSAQYVMTKPSRARIVQYGVDCISCVLIAAMASQLSNLLMRAGFSKVTTEPSSSAAADTLLSALKAIHSAWAARVDRNVHAFMCHVTVVAGPSSIALNAWKRTTPAEPDVAISSYVSSLKAWISCELSPAHLRFLSAIEASAEPELPYLKLHDVISDILPSHDLPWIFEFVKKAFDADVDAGTAPLWMSAAHMVGIDISQVIRKRHEVQDWPWPSLTPSQTEARRKLSELPEAFR